MIEILTPIDLNAQSRHTPYWKVKINDFHRINRNNILGSHMAVYIEKYHVVILKCRKHYQNYISSSPVKRDFTIDNIQQEWLAQLVDNAGKSGITVEDLVVVCNTLQRCGYTYREQEILNRLRTNYIENER